MVFLGFYSVISAMHVLFVEFCVLHINSEVGAPAVSYAAPECLVGRLRDQSKLTVRLLGRRHRILMEGRTSRVRAISHGMKLLA